MISRKGPPLGKLVITLCQLNAVKSTVSAYPQYRPSLLRSPHAPRVGSSYVAWGLCLCTQIQAQDRFMLLALGNGYMPRPRSRSL